MPEIEHLHEHPFVEDHSLYLIECSNFWEIVPTLEVPSSYFICLLVADFDSISRDELVEVSERLIGAGARYLCAWGKGCSDAHLAFDLACCEYESDETGVIFTTDHKREPLEDAIWYVLNVAFVSEPCDRDCHATVGICVNQRNSAEILRTAFNCPVEFSDKLAEVEEDF